MGRIALLPVFVVPAAICALWTVFAGKDVNWDLLNYHYYLPFEWLAGRVQQDFFAASAQSYLNPVGYLPFYAMVSAGWHSVLVSVALAALHSLNIAFLYLIALKLFRELPQAQRIGISWLAAALGVATAIFWAMVGTSFLDPLLAALLLAGVLLLLGGHERAARQAALAGALFGAATALKYSSAVFAVAAAPIVLAVVGAERLQRLRVLVAYTAGAALAVALLAGPWFLVMTREFGNPVFPLMNGWFRSPYAPTINTVGERFAPESVGAALALPFRMAALDRSLYAEIFAPDIRLAGLILALIALLATALVPAAHAGKALNSSDRRLLCFLGLGFVLWVLTSANARYGLVLLLLSGVALARTIERLFPLPAARVAIALILVVQIGMSIEAAPARWFIAESWSRQWFPYAVPERAQREPALYLTLETLPMAVVAPFVHPASSFVNFRGQHSIPPDSPRLASLLEQHRGRVRVLGRSLELIDGRPRPSDLKAYDDTLVRIGYRIDTADCFSIAWRPDDDDVISRAANSLARVSASHEPLSVVSCALLPAAREPRLVEKERQISSVFDRIEKGCPKVFHGQSAVTEPLGSGWSRHYAGLDARLEVYPERVILNRYRSGVYVELGRLADWDREAPLIPPACR